MAKRGKSSMTVCSTSFMPLGRAQAKALGYPDLPIAVIPHPFGICTRDEVRQIAESCAADIERLVTGKQ
jgi:hypothetical protein